ncbi:hypothetical protein D9M68_424690 [compost metagenome]
MRAGAGLGVALEAEGVLVGTLDALQGAVEQRLVGGAQVARQGRLVDGEAVVLAGDHHHAAVEVLHRVVGAMVAMAHLHGLGAGGQAEQLVAEADAEDRDLGVEELADRLDGVVARLGVAGAVGEEDAVRIQRQHFARRSLRRHHGQAAAAGDQHAQDVQLDAEVIGNHVVRQIGGGDFRVAVGFQVPHAGAPFVTLGAGNHLGQVQPLHARETARQFEGFFFGGIVASEDAAVLRTLLAQDTGQTAGIDAGNGDGAVFLQVVRQGLPVAPAAGEQRQVADDQAGGPDLVRLGVFRGGAGVADVRIGQGDDLLGVGRIGKDFLVAGHGGVEHHFANGMAIGTDGLAAKDAAVSKGEYGWLSQEDLP